MLSVPKKNRQRRSASNLIRRLELRNFRSRVKSGEMCGRFRLGKGREALKKYFRVENDLDWDPRYNIAPTQDVATIRQDYRDPKRVLSPMRWGLVPSWSKDST